MLHGVYKDTTSKNTDTHTKHLGCKEHHEYARLSTFNGVFEVYKLVAVWNFYAPTYTILCSQGKLYHVVYCPNIDILKVTRSKSIL